MEPSSTATIYDLTKLASKCADIVDQREKQVMTNGTIAASADVQSVMKIVGLTKTYNGSSPFNDLIKPGMSRLDRERLFIAELKKVKMTSEDCSAASVRADSAIKIETARAERLQKAKNAFAKATVEAVQLKN